VAPPNPDVFDRAYVEELRKEAAKYRTSAGEEKAAREAAATLAVENAAKMAEQQAMLDVIMKAVNPGAEIDPAKLAEQLTAEKAASEAAAASQIAERDEKIRLLTIQSTLPTVFQKTGAQPDLTTAVLTANGTLSTLDPTSATFAADLESAVIAALESHPALKIAPVAVRSGTEIAGRSGGTDQLTREQVAELAKTPGALEKARKEGRLKNLGIG
jgi:hypothetical protein